MTTNIKLEYRNVCDDGIREFPICFSVRDNNNINAILSNVLKDNFEKWQNEPEIAKRIFSELVKHDVLDFTQYGIDNKEEQNTVINLERKTVDNVRYEEFIKINIK